MRLCPECYEKLKIVPNLVKTGSGRACFGGTLCDECEKRIRTFVVVEISNKNIEIHDFDQKYIWDCHMCGAKKTMESSHQYFSDRLNKLVPAGSCECSACGNKALCCPQAEGIKGTLGTVGKPLES